MMLAAALPAAPVQVTFGGTVTSEPHYFVGSHTHSTHEEFDVRTTSGENVDIVDNVDLAPRVPVHTGDAVTVRGELVAAHDGGLLVHYTHHDPRGHHADGFIDFHGRRYA